MIWVVSTVLPYNNLSYNWYSVQLNYFLLKSVNLEYYHLDVCLALKTKVEFRITYFRGGKVNSGCIELNYITMLTQAIGRVKMLSAEKE